jgi:hypothetical protein
MSVGKWFFGRFMVASMGLFATVSAQAFSPPRLGLSISVINDWADPADPAARYGIASFATTLYTPSVERPFFNPGERLTYERQIKALGGYSERIQAVIDCLGFVATAVLERYATAQGTAGEKVAAIKDAIADHGNIAHQHVPAAGLAASEASDGDDEQEFQSPETVQAATAAITGLKQYVDVQQSVLNSLEEAIGTIQAMDTASVSDEELGNAMEALRELVSYWQKPETSIKSPETDGTVPVSFHR